MHYDVETLSRDDVQQLAIQQVMVMSARAGTGSDLELLEQLIARRSESAFTHLMHRHGAMVLGVCRRILRHTQDAEDACQATFLVLAQRAAAIEKRESLASWLYGVAARISLRLKKMRQVTAGNEGLLTCPPSTRNSAMTETLHILDQEMARLPDQYRAPLVLCFLEGRTQDEAAKQLGWPLTTLRGRLERGRLALRKRLQNRGLDLSVMLLGIGVTGSASAQFPSALAQAITQAMQAGSVQQAAQQGLVAASVSLSAEQFMKSMSINQWVKGAFALVALLGLVGIGTWAMAVPAPAAKVVFDDKPVTVQPIAKEGRVEGRVLDEDGKPVAGATVQVMLDGLPNHLAMRNAVSGVDGKYVIEVPFGHAMLWGINPPAGYYSKYLESHRSFLTSKEEPISQQDGKLLRGMPWRIQVDDFSLIEGEKLLLIGIDNPDYQGMRPAGNYLNAQGNPDNIGTLSVPWSGGEYRFSVMPSKSWGKWDIPAIDLTIDANFQPTNVAQVKNDPQGYKVLIDQAGKTAKVRHAEVNLKNGLVTLSNKAKKVTKDKLLTMKGRIVNEENMPVAGAKVIVIYTSKLSGGSSPFSSISDEDGSFTIDDIQRATRAITDDAEISVSAVASKYSVTQSRKLKMKDVEAKGTGDVGTIKLELGKTLRGKVVDENDKPLQGATVTDQTNYLLYQSQCRTDANGEFVIEGLRYGKLSLGVQYGERSKYESITFDEKHTSFTFVPKLQAKPGYREAAPTEVKKPAVKVDDWKIQPPTKEPVYQHTPLYALVVFGLHRDQTVWLVLDGRTLYIDRNGNGDLTEADDKLTMLPPDKETTRVGNPGFYSHFDVARTTLLLKGHEQETLELLQWMRDEKFVPKTENERQQKADHQQRGSERFLFTRKKNGVESSYGQIFIRDKNDVQVLHLDGPLTFGLKMREQALLQRGPAGSDLAFHIGTPGRSTSWSKNPTFSPLMINEVPEAVYLMVEIEFPGKASVAEPIVKQFTLKSRCCGDTFHGPVFVPSDAGTGFAKVTVRAHGWGETFVQPKTFLVAIE